MTKSGGMRQGGPIEQSLNVLRGRAVDVDSSWLLRVFLHRLGLYFDVLNGLVAGNKTETFRHIVATCVR